MTGQQFKRSKSQEREVNENMHERQIKKHDQCSWETNRKNESMKQDEGFFSYYSLENNLVPSQTNSF